MTDLTEMWLFGSAARGDNDPHSDVDVLVAGPFDPAAVKQLPYPSAAVSVVQYSWAELHHMAGYGSLFLEHVRREGRALVASRPPRLESLLANMPRYTRASQELLSFFRVLDDVERSTNDDFSTEFELSVIATALRHACILGSYAIGRPSFGRSSAFEVYLRHVGRSYLIDAVKQLYVFRLHEEGRAPVPFRPSKDTVRDWLFQARIVLSDVQRSLYGDNRTMPSSDQRRLGSRG